MDTKERKLKEGDTIISTISGESMIPTLWHNNQILIKKISPFKLKERDIVVYKNDFINVAHRIIKIKRISGELVFSVRGDSNRKIEKVSSNKIIGKVIAVYRRDKLELFTYENSLIYYLFVNLLSIFKELLRRIIGRLYFFSFFRRIIRLIFLLKVNYFSIENVGKNKEFKSFYNFYHFSADKYIPSFGFLAKSKNIPVGKLCILKDKNDNYFLYGPCVKLLYRARGIGTTLVRKTSGILHTKVKGQYIYALCLRKEKALFTFYKKLGFALDDKSTIRMKNFVVFKKQLS